MLVDAPCQGVQLGAVEGPGRGRYRLGSLWSLSGKMTTLQASLHAADRPVASTPLRRWPLDQHRGLRYRGPWRLPGPDSHRLADVSLSSGYVMRSSPSSQRPNCWTHTSGFVGAPG